MTAARTTKSAADGADSFKTLREVGIAISGVESRLSLMTKVFAGAVVIAVGCFGYLFFTTTQATNQLAALTAKVEAVQAQQDRFEGKIDDALDLLGTIQQQTAATESPTGLPTLATGQAFTIFPAATANLSSTDFYQWQSLAPKGGIKVNATDPESIRALKEAVEFGLAKPLD